MLLFDNYNIKVYARALERPRDKAGTRRIAELAAEKRLLREAFPDHSGAVIEHAESGAPFLKINGMEQAGLPVISISHSLELAVLAVAPAGTRIGVDTETGDRGAQLARVSRRFLSDRQLPFWGSNEATMLWAWTIKEALYKAAHRPLLAMADIPLPLEVPLERETADGQVELDGRKYTVLEIDSQQNSVIMLAFSPPYSIDL